MVMISASIVVLFLVALSSSSSSSSSPPRLSILLTEAKKSQSTINNSHGTSRSSSSKNTNPATTKRSTSSSSSSNRSIQRIKQEYKSIINDNIAYDWLRQERILPRRRSKKNKKNKNNNNKTAASSETLLMENKEKKKENEDEDGSNDVGIDGDATEDGSVKHRSDHCDTNDNDNNIDSDSGSDTDTIKNGYDHDDHDVCIGPLTDNIYHWHFSFRGAAGSVYEDGLYHGRFILPKDFPLSPPKVQVWTPNGRFRTHYDICLSASSFHPESWSPQWTIPSLVQALRIHMITSPNEIGGIESSRERTLELAEQSWSWELQSTYNTKKGRGAFLIDHDLLVQQGAITKPTDKTTTTTTSAEKNKTSDNTKSTINSTKGDTSVKYDDDLETKDDEHATNQLPIKIAQHIQGDRNDSSTLRAVVDCEDNHVGDGEENTSGTDVSTLSARNPNVVAVEKKKSKTKKKKKKTKGTKSTVTSSINTKGLVEKPKQQDQQVLQSPSPLSILPTFLRRHPTKLLIRSIIVLLLLFVWFRP